MTYIESLRFLYSLADFERSGRFADREDVEPVRLLLAELDNPHLGRLTVHIAGSKGKGSVAAMTESILRAAGLKTGLFTSPHLHRFVERITVEGSSSADTTTSRTVSPPWMRSPFFRKTDSTRCPFTKVPFVEPRSRRKAWGGAISIRQ